MTSNPGASIPYASTGTAIPAALRFLPNWSVDGDDIKWEDTAKFVIPITGGRVIKVYDGDTITVAAQLPYPDSDLYRFAVRLNGIDTPEMKGPGVSEDEKTAAKRAQQVLSEKILNRYVQLRNVDTEKYGRLLADVFLGDECVNAFLIRERYALPYSGGTKQKPASWTKFHLTGSMD